MARKISNQEYFDYIDSVDAYDELDQEITNEKYSIPQLFDSMREDRELQQLLNDELYEFDEVEQDYQFGDWI